MKRGSMFRSLQTVLWLLSFCGIAAAGSIVFAPLPAGLGSGLLLLGAIGLVRMARHSRSRRAYT